MIRYDKIIEDLLIFLDVFFQSSEKISSFAFEDLHLLICPPWPGGDDFPEGRV